MNKSLTIRLLVWFAALLALGLAGAWFFRAPTPWSITGLIVAVTFYVGMMAASCYVSIVGQKHQPCAR